MEPPTADLPDDLIVEILARLPAGSLCRCKFVSRSWRSLIFDPAHHARLAHTLSGFFVFSRPHSAAAPSSWSFVATPQSLPLQGEGEGGAPLVDTALSFLPSSHGEIEILDSCNGLLLLRCSGDQRHPFYVICNQPQPSHAPGHKINPLGYSIKTTSAALGFDPAVSSYFYAFQFVEEEMMHGDVIREVEIYSSETGTWVSRKSGWDESVFFAGHKTYFKGFLYLTTSIHDEIASLDTKGQTWRLTPAGGYHGVDCYDMGVGHSQGRLLSVLKDQSRDSLSIRDVQDHGNKGRTVKHSVSKMDLIGSRESQWPVYHKTIALHPDGNFIFFLDLPSGRFMCYDMIRRDVHVICTVGADRCNHLFFPYVPFYSMVLVSPN
ncbi:unnamed protein product [Urochloa humidicola]